MTVVIRQMNRCGRAAAHVVWNIETKSNPRRARMCINAPVATPGMSVVCENCRDSSRATNPPRIVPRGGLGRRAVLDLQPDHATHQPRPSEVLFEFERASGTR